MNGESRRPHEGDDGTQELAGEATVTVARYLAGPLDGATVGASASHRMPDGTPVEPGVTVPGPVPDHMYVLLMGDRGPVYYWSPTRLVGAAGVTP